MNQVFLTASYRLTFEFQVNVIFKYFPLPEISMTQRASFPP